MSEYLLWGIMGCFVIACVALCFMVWVGAKYNKVKSQADVEFNGYPEPIYDLYEYTQWLAQKGALVEGFGENHLVEDYCRER